MTGSLIWEAQVKAAEIMFADPDLITKLDGEKVYDTEIPSGFLRPHRFVVIGEVPGEILAGSFGRGGKDSLIWFHIWDDGIQPDGSIRLGKENPLAIAADLERLFNNRSIALETWTMKLGEFTMVRLARDSAIPYMHGIMQYRILGKAPVAP